MANEDQPRWATAGPATRPLSPEVDREVRELIDTLLDGTIDPQRSQRLEVLVLENPTAAILYYELVHLWCILPLHLSRSGIDLRTAEREDAVGATALDEAMILPAIREFGSVDEPDVPERIPTGPSLVSMPLQRNARRAWWWASAAAALLLASGLTARVLVWPAPVAVASGPHAETGESVTGVPAVLTATAGAVFDGGSTLPARSNLTSGIALRLQQGAVELTLASGAVAIVRGPAQVWVSDKNGLSLDYGEVTAHVPAAAHGFHVVSPGLSVVDLGTDFGVRSVRGSERSDLDVFNGTVNASWVSPAGRRSSVVQHVTAGQAVQYDSDRQEPIDIAYRPTEFVRDIAAVRLPVPTANTGAGVTAGSPDPHWQVASVPGNPTWQPKQAIVLRRVYPTYTPNTPDGKWISIGNDKIVSAGDYVFDTTLDLTGFDPATVSASAQVAADNYVRDILVNGVSTGASTPGSKAMKEFLATPVTLPAKCWRGGLNRLNIVVVNTNYETPDGPSFTGLRLLWTVTASPLIRR